MKNDVNNKELLQNIFNIVLNYIQQYYVNNKELIQYKTSGELARSLNLQISNSGISEDQLTEEIKTYLKYSVKTGHKQFFNQLYAGFTLPGFIAEVITALTNTSMYTYEVAPAATLIEKELIRKMCKITGFEDGSGTFVTGGSNANLIAIFSARNKVFGEGKNKGLYQSKVLTAFVSDQSHYSFKTAANLTGIGADNLIKVKSDGNGRMIPDELEKALIRSLQEGKLPFFIAGTAGTTMLGAFDDFTAIAQIAKKYDCHFHIDGSFGGSLILSKNHRHLFKGIEMADSFAWNPHKLMNVPLIASVILFNDNRTLKHNLTKLNTDYIFHEQEDNCDLGESSIQCGKRNDALKVWLTWKFFGDAGYEKRMDHLMDMAQYCKDKVQNTEQLELMADVNSLTVCFRYNDEQEQDLNKFNLQVREYLRKSGMSMVNYGYIDDELVIRFVVANADVQQSDIDTFIQNFEKAAKHIKKNTNLDEKRFNHRFGMAPNAR